MKFFTISRIWLIEINFYTKIQLNVKIQFYNKFTIKNFPHFRIIIGIIFVQLVVENLCRTDLLFNTTSTSFHLSRRVIFADKNPVMGKWKSNLFHVRVESWSVMDSSGLKDVVKKMPLPPCKNTSRQWAQHNFIRIKYECATAMCNDITMKESQKSPKKTLQQCCELVRNN